MMNFVKYPNLPQKKTNLFITSAVLDKQILPPSVPKLENTIRFHADLGICHIGGSRFVTAKNTFEYYKERLKGAELICGNTTIESPYPLDASYCAAVFGKYAAANEKITDRVLLELLKSEYIFIDVNQGYAKCNICPITQNAVITEDSGIAKVLMNYVDVLLIEKGHIRLPGYAYGFIGGAAGMIDKDVLFINGSIKKHPDRDKICGFLKKYNVKLKEASEIEPKDVGSIIPVFEE
ncbi:MAG: hypothetical protein Q8882_09510 [Bacillota bacterium]|nr:hypothetical protein [Bacillota bacterium]